MPAGGLDATMSDLRRSIGRAAEELAARRLAAAGWEIIERNARSRYGELDIVARDRRTLRDRPPHILITTPESLALLLSQSDWRDRWRGVEHIVVDEAHALVPTKRGADLAVSLERLADASARDPRRIGLSATCRPPDPVARFLVGPSRACRVIEAPRPAGSPAASAPTGSHK